MLVLKPGKRHPSTTMKRLIAGLFCIASFMPGPLFAEFRTWSNTEGAKVEAELVKSEGDNVTLRLRNGKLATFTQTKLSEADRDFIKNNPVQAQQEAQPAVEADRKAKWLTKLSKAQEESKKTGLPILVLFTGTSWCPYCIKLENSVFSEKAFKSFANENLVLLKLDFEAGGETNDKEHKRLQEDYGVKGFPTYFLTDASGTKLAQGGYHDGINPDDFAAWVKKAAPKSN
jgi:thiol:disulfide interchange protein